MNQSPIFCSGLDLASLVVSSDLLHRSWEAIINTKPNETPIFRVFRKPPNLTVIVFVTCSYPQEGDLVSSTTLEQRFPLSDFLCTKDYPSFSIHKTAINRFASIQNSLSDLKNQFVKSTDRLIITGRSLGGSIASLFTLWLLESMDPSTTKRPLCITFGSPFIGDDGLRKTTLNQSWNSSFLHVFSNQEQVLPISFSSPQNPYKPFGTFLLCNSESGCACFEDPDSIINLLRAMEIARIQDPSAASQMVNYGEILNHLKDWVLLKEISELDESITQPVEAGINTQLEAVGVTNTQQHQQQIKTVISKMQKWEKDSSNQKRFKIEAVRKLNKIKINMAHLEWYKKKSEPMGYYDRYKNESTPSDVDATNYKKKLCVYWKKMVEEVEKSPQKEGASFRIAWLYAGTNYRRMVEPLDIAEYYKQGLRDYQTQGRSHHYKLLEKWQQNEEKPNMKPRKKAVSLTEDSCFWADVEEAIISCKLLKSAESSNEEKESSKERLIKFEEYVMDLIDKFAVSPEIFWKQSTFMKWWEEYKKIIGTFISDDSQFVQFMKGSGYRNYA